ncbi:MAG TPA: GNAT family N-acetyltransferase [Anaerolineales bacterium]|nr:GNAT family N-acetyltransferase [Anaerolineales bacterium]
MPLDLPLPAAAQGHLRRLNTQRDLESVANLVELCFDDTLDAEGRTYLRNMRESARSAQWTGWVNSLAEYSPTPPSGLVWEENGQLVGNLSLIPIICRGQRCYLIANVAVHPDHRGRGIGRTLTATALDYIRSRNAPSAWLQVRHDNPPAIHIYQALGFQERTRRTTWFVSNQAPQVHLPPGTTISSRRRQHWPQQRQWLQRLYPPELSWHLPLDWTLLQPGLVGAIYRLLNLDAPTHWVIQRPNEMLGALTWRRIQGHADPLWLAVPPQPDNEALLALLAYARQRVTPQRPLTVNLPADLSPDVLRQAGFYPHQTLLWMEYAFKTKDER